MATLGIDFGTSYTFLVKKDGDKFQAYGRKGLYKANTEVDNLLCGSPGIRSVIGYNAEADKWVVGEDVYNPLYGVQKENICSDLKAKVAQIICYQSQEYASEKQTPERYIGNLEELNTDSTLQIDDFGKWFIDKNGKQFYKSAIDLSKIFFEKIFEDPYGDSSLQDVDYIVFGAPAHELECSSGVSIATEYKSEVIDEIFNHIRDKAQKSNPKGVNLKDYVVRPEPVLAGVAYTYLLPKWVNIGDNVLVIDIGGGTSDFAFIQRTDSHDNFVLPVSANGWTAPAGKEFDEAVIDSFAEKITISPQNATYAKERMFLTREDFLIENPELRSNINSAKSAYEKYRSTGRWASIVENNETYSICYDSDHSRGSNDIYYSPKFLEQCRNLTDHIKKYVSKSKNPKYSTVLFVGGTSNSDLLRAEVLDGLGIKERNGRYYKDGSSEQIHVVFFSTIASAVGRVQLTCANAVAIGGAVLADAIFSSVRIDVQPRSIGISVPEIRIRVKGDPTKRVPLLLSHKLKTFGKDNEITEWPQVYEYAPGEDKVEFQIFYEGKPYPSDRKYYWFKLPTNHTAPIDVMFLADVNCREELAIFCYIITPATSQKTIESYEMEIITPDSNPLKAGFPPNTRASRENLRVYSIRLNSPEEGRPFSSTSKSRKKSPDSLGKNDMFGWRLKD